MKIAITGTRGIPNRYGGFEHFAEKVSVGLVQRGHEVWVYNPYFHPYEGGEFQGVKILHKKSPEGMLGSGGNYLYDFYCLKDAIRRKADVILECGYASAAPWYPVLRWKGTKLITHMDGMEWQRKKWSKLSRKIIRRAEARTVRYSDALVCDHPAVADYYRESYSVSPEIIPYGAEIREDWEEGELVDAGNFNIRATPDDEGAQSDAGKLAGTGKQVDVGLKPGAYYLLVARMEPENNIRMIIEGFLASGAGEPLVLVGDHSGRHGRLIFKEFGNDRRLRFMGGIFDRKRLDHLRHYSKAVFHGHSVGGTNPSLLEAMAAGSFIIAHDNIFNKWVLGDNAGYFQSEQEVSDLLAKIDELKQSAGAAISNNLERIQSEFQWDSVVSQYEKLFSRRIMPMF